MKDIFGNYRSWLLAEQQNSTFQHNKEVLQTATIGVADESAYNHVVHPHYVNSAVGEVLEGFADAAYRIGSYERGLHSEIASLMTKVTSEVYKIIALLDPNKDPISAANNWRGYSQTAEDVAGPESPMAKLSDEFNDYGIPLEDIKVGMDDQIMDLSVDIVRYVQDFYFQSIPALQKEKLGKHLGSGMYGAVFQFADKKGVVFKIGTRLTSGYKEEKEKVGKETKFYDDAMSDLFSKKATKSTLPVYDHGQVLLEKENLAKIKELIMKRLNTETHGRKGIAVYVKLLLSYIDEMKEVFDGYFDTIPNDVLDHLNSGGERTEIYKSLKLNYKQLDRHYMQIAQSFNELESKVNYLVDKIAKLYTKDSLYYAEIGEVNIAENFVKKEIGDRIPPEINKLNKQFSQYDNIDIAEAFSTQLGNAYESLRGRYQKKVGDRFRGDLKSKRVREDMFKKSKNFKQYIEDINEYNASRSRKRRIDFDFDREIKIGFKNALIPALHAMEDQFINGKILQLIKPTSQQKEKVANEISNLFKDLTRFLQQFYKEFMYKSFEAVYDLEKKSRKTTGKGGRYLWGSNTFDVHFGNFGFAADGTAVVYDP
tara:strand:- start:289 stop:2076 length:1788 start_codon:yes stop_codon:yes gene_type:complete